MQEKRLLRKLRKGDADALRQIYEKYSGAMVSVAVSLLGDISAAEDCLHDVFVNFAGSAAECRVRSNLKSYLISCIANRARDQLRKKKRHQTWSLQQPDGAATAGDPTTEMIEGEDARLVFEALGKLPAEQREVFVLHAQGEMTFGRIAAIVGAPINTVQSRYRYAIQKLRSVLGKGYKNGP